MELFGFNVKDNIKALYAMWLMNCPGPRVYRWLFEERSKT